MRLLRRLQTGEFSLTHDYVENPPFYAILSHTWGRDADEVVFDDLATVNLNKNKAGYRKLEFCAKQVEEDGLQYFWVDTCCINKSNHAELAEAIASMFRWYQNATKCYVYLSDVSSNDWNTSFRKSRWFTRGWTLQELLAPRIVEFFSQEGERLGDKTSFEQAVHDVTKIPIAAFRGDKALSSFSIEERLAWASQRKTTRKEDAAYCLQGIFSVFIPLIYGEGDHAWVRLRRAITESQNPDWFQTPLIARSQDENDNRIQESLAFAEMHDRRLKVEPRHERTCEWILDVSNFKEWLSLSQGLLWIKGKPGSGKSTVMAYLYDELLKRTTVPIVKLDFFLTARGTELQRTFPGLLRSLVSQLFFQDPATRNQIRLNYQSKMATFGKTKASWEWQQSELETMFSCNVVELAQQQSVTIFVDALDESGESSARRIAEYFHRLNDLAVSKQAQLKICISCRHYPIVTSRIYSLEIVVEHHNNKDIASFFNDKLYLEHAAVDDSSDDWQTLKTDLTERAQGVFQWAHLVTPLVQKYIDNAESPRQVRKKLQRVPAQLQSVYTYILETVIDETDRESALRLFRWVCLARRPLTLTEIRYAMAINEDVRPFSADNPDWINTNERMKRRIKAVSGGLVEVVSPKSKSEEAVQVGHQSVTDFILSTGLTLLLEWTGSRTIPSDLTCWSHARLYWSCLAYLMANDVQALEIIHVQMDYRSLPYYQLPPEMKLDRAVRLSRDEIYAELPFLNYAVCNVFIHAGMAQRHRSTDFRKELFVLEQTVPRWVRIYYSLFEDKSAILWSSTLLHVASYYNLIDVVNHFGTDGVDLDCRDIHRQTPLHLATRNGHQEIAQSLVTAGADVNVTDHYNDTPLLNATRGSYTSLVKWLLDHGALVNPPANTDRDALGVAAGIGNINMVRMLIQAGSLINAPARFYGTPLCAAIFAGHEQISKLLVESGADTNAQGCLCLPLCIASSKGYRGITEFLLKRGVSVDSIDQNGSALCGASANGHLDIVKTLLAAKANVHIGERGVFPSALFAAVKRDHVEIVKLLIKSGANVNLNSQDDRKSTPLTAAAGFGSEESIKLLLKAGAHVDALGPQGTPLIIATRKGRREVVRLLLDAGATLNLPDSHVGQEHTPLYVAKLFNFQDLVQLFLDNGAT